MSIRSNTKAAFVTPTGWIPLKNLHIDIEFAVQAEQANRWHKLFACETTQGVFPTIIDTTATVLPLEEEASDGRKS